MKFPHDILHLTKLNDLLKERVLIEFFEDQHTFYIVMKRVKDFEFPLELYKTGFITSEQLDLEAVSDFILAPNIIT